MHLMWKHFPVYPHLLPLLQIQANLKMFTVALRVLSSHWRCLGLGIKRKRCSCPLYSSVTKRDPWALCVFPEKSLPLCWRAPALCWRRARHSLRHSLHSCRCWDTALGPLLMLWHWLAVLSWEGQACRNACWKHQVKMHRMPTLGAILQSQRNATQRSVTWELHLQCKCLSPAAHSHFRQSAILSSLSPGCTSWTSTARPLPSSSWSSSTNRISSSKRSSCWQKKCSFCEHRYLCQKKRKSEGNVLQL